MHSCQVRVCLSPCTFFLLHARACLRAYACVCVCTLVCACEGKYTLGVVNRKSKNGRETKSEVDNVEVRSKRRNDNASRHSSTQRWPLDLVGLAGLAHCHGALLEVTRRDPIKAVAHMCIYTHITRRIDSNQPISTYLWRRSCLSRPLEHAACTRSARMPCTHPVYICMHMHTGKHIRA